MKRAKRDHLAVCKPRATLRERTHRNLKDTRGWNVFNTFTFDISCHRDCLTNLEVRRGENESQRGRPVIICPETLQKLKRLL